MRNVLFILIVPGLFLIGCRGNGVTNINHNYNYNGCYNYDNHSVLLSNMYITGCVNEPDSVGKQLDVWLFSKNIPNPHMLDSIRSDVVVFKLYSDKSNYLNTGIYTWKNDNNKNAFTIDGGFLGKNYLMNMTDRIQNCYEFIYCDVIVNRTADEYEIEFTAYLSNYKQVTGYYKGSFSSF